MNNFEFRVTPKNVAKETPDINFNLESELPLIKRECPACHQMKKFRSDVKTCGCGGTNPFSGKVAKTDNKISPENVVEIELSRIRDKREGREKTIQILQQRILHLEEENRVLLDLQDIQPQVIDVLPKVSSGKSESAAVFVWSDWHIEESVYPEQVSNKNEYNLEIADARFLRLLHGGLAWWKIASRDTTIKTIVLALLGDFITGSIHADLAEGNQLGPSDAIHKAYSMIVTGIKFMLNNTPPDVNFVIPCHSGNHGRMTQKQRIATESGNSLEYFMYLMLQEYFQDEKRLTFVIQPGYHSYVRFFEGAFNVRFHHGHQMNYQGGVGGISISVNKAIAQWNKSVPDISLDVFGHFHTKYDGGTFISNGSLIGMTAYGVSIKAGWEPPSQTFFLVNREYAAKTLVAPIFVQDQI